MKRSKGPNRVAIERLFWENAILIDKYLQSLNLSPTILHNQQQQLPSNYEQLLSQYMVSEDSDFYLIKMIINSRVDKLFAYQKEG